MESTQTGQSNTAIRLCEPEKDAPWNYSLSGWTWGSREGASNPAWGCAMRGETSQRRESLSYVFGERLWLAENTRRGEKQGGRKHFTFYAVLVNSARIYFPTGSQPFGRQGEGC